MVAQLIKTFQYRIHDNPPLVHMQIKSTSSHFIILRSTLILSSYLHLGLSHQIFRLKILTHFSCLLFVLHAPPITYSLIWSH